MKILKKLALTLGFLTLGTAYAANLTWQQFIKRIPSMDGTIFHQTYINHNNITDYLFTRQGLAIAPNTCLKATDIDNRGIQRLTIDYFMGDNWFFRYIDREKTGPDMNPNIIELWEGNKIIYHKAVRDLEDVQLKLHKDEVDAPTLKEVVIDQYNRFANGHLGKKQKEFVNPHWYMWADKKLELISQTYANTKRQKRFNTLYSQITPSD